MWKFNNSNWWRHSWSSHNTIYKYYLDIFRRDHNTNCDPTISRIFWKLSIFFLQNDPRFESVLTIDQLSAFVESTIATGITSNGYLMFKRVCSQSIHCCILMLQYYCPFSFLIFQVNSIEAISCLSVHWWKFCWNCVLLFTKWNDLCVSAD